MICRLQKVEEFIILKLLLKVLKFKMGREGVYLSNKSLCQSNPRQTYTSSSHKSCLYWKISQTSVFLGQVRHYSLLCNTTSQLCSTHPYSEITIVNHANHNLHTSAKFNLINLRIRGASFDVFSCVENNHIRRRYNKPPEYGIDFDIHTSTARSQITTAKVVNGGGNPGD